MNLMGSVFIMMTGILFIMLMTGGFHPKELLTVLDLMNPDWLDVTTLDIKRTEGLFQPRYISLSLRVLSLNVVISSFILAIPSFSPHTSCHCYSLV